MSRWLRILMAVTDFGFVIYWSITLLHAIPAEWAFKGYDNPVLVAWNWSFLPLDLLISSTGLTALVLHWRRDPRYQLWVLISLVLTCCSGLQAISYWSMARDFDWVWWLPNLFLLVYPLPFVVGILRSGGRRSEPVAGESRSVL